MPGTDPQLLIGLAGLHQISLGIEEVLELRESQGQFVECGVDGKHGVLQGCGQHRTGLRARGPAPQRLQQQRTCGIHAIVAQRGATFADQAAIGHEVVAGADQNRTRRMLQSDADHRPAMPPQAPGHRRVVTVTTNDDEDLDLRPGQSRFQGINHQLDVHRVLALAGAAREKQLGKVQGMVRHGLAVGPKPCPVGIGPAHTAGAPSLSLSHDGIEAEEPVGVLSSDGDVLEIDEHRSFGSGGLHGENLLIVPGSESRSRSTRCRGHAGPRQIVHSIIRILHAIALYHTMIGDECTNKAQASHPRLDVLHATWVRTGCGSCVPTASGGSLSP